MKGKIVPAWGKYVAVLLIGVLAYQGKQIASHSELSSNSEVMEEVADWEVFEDQELFYGMPEAGFGEVPRYSWDGEFPPQMDPELSPVIRNDYLRI